MRNSMRLAILEKNIRPIEVIPEMSSVVFGD
jgi:hypothetical protein